MSQDDVIDLLEANPEGLTLKEMAEQLDQGLSSLSTNARRLVNSGEIYYKVKLNPHGQKGQRRYFLR